MEYVPDISETEIAKKVSKSVSEAESKIMENTNIYQYGGFKSKTDREKLKEKLINSSNEPSNTDHPAISENPEYYFFKKTFSDRYISCGASLVVTKQSPISKFWSSLKEINPLTSSTRNYFFALLMYRMEQFQKKI